MLAHIHTGPTPPQPMGFLSFWRRFAWHLTKTTLLVSALSLVTMQDLRAQDVAENESGATGAVTADQAALGRRQAGETAVYIEAGGSPFSRAVVLSAEVMASERVAISGGWGASAYQFFSSSSGQGPRVQVHYLAGRGPHLFEVAIGATWDPWQWGQGNTNEYLRETSHIGYRRQSGTGGVVFRTGLNYMQHLHSLGLSASVGWAF